MGRYSLQFAELGLVEDDMADIASAFGGLNDCWTRIRQLCYRPMTTDDIDAMSKALREIEAGLMAGQRSLIRERKRA